MVVVLVEMGQRIGPFELVERLGVARGTTLFRAVRPEGMREPSEVAIRVADHLDVSAAVESVRREYEVLRALDDPRLPKVHGFYPGQAALAVSWRGGVSLGEVLTAARAGWIELDPATALDIGVEIAGALRAAHNVVLQGRPVVHGHLDPSRVRLDEDGEVSVVGFGVERNNQWLGCSAPEQSMGEPATPAADQWALGAILVEMLLLRRLYEDLDDPASAALDGAVGPWVSAIETLHPSLGRVLRKMLAANPEDRYPWDGEIVQALLAESREHGGVSGRRAIAATVLHRRRAMAAPSPDPVPMSMETPREPEPAVPSGPHFGAPQGPLPPQPATSSGLRIAIRPSRADEDEPEPVVGVSIGKGLFPDDDSDDPFPDSPTSPDNYARLSDALFSEDPTDSGLHAEGVDLREGDSEPDLRAPPRLTSPIAAPKPKPAPQLQLAERAGLGLALVLACVAVLFLLTRLM